ncbi:MAG: hypothetical protein KA314_10590 [Chloroflexi bacterium]|nr:hypothetical protein [Chloroflexota bacterium]MBP8056282.1 hypothetical protein [Chloroflexota bacterium]
MWVRIKANRFLGLGLVLWLVACAGDTTNYQWVKAPGWSRAIEIGVTQVGDPAPMALDAVGNSYFFLVKGEGELRPQIRAYSPAMSFLWETPVPVVLILPDKPRLFWQNDGLALFWLSNRSLHYAEMNSSGELVLEPVMLSPEGVVIDNYSVAYDQQGQAHVWFAGAKRSPGLYALTLAEGETENAAALVDAQGVVPSLLLDSTNTLHAAWSRQPQGGSSATILYAHYPQAIYVPEQQTVLLEKGVNPTSIFRGPELGLEEGKTYVFWTEEVRTGPTAGAIDSRYVTFAPGEPETVSPVARLVAPTLAELPYVQWPQATFAVGPRVNNLTEEYPISGAVNDIVVNKAVGAELPLAFHNSNVQFESRQTNGQVALLYMQDGIPTSYQLISYSTGSAHAPFLLSNTDNELYLTWLEAATPSGFHLYMTATAPQVVAALDQLSSSDLTQMGGVAAFGMLSGIVLSPLVVFVWLIVPMIVVGFTFIFHRGYNEDQLTVGGVISIVLAMAAYWVVKLFSLPNIFVYVPFSTWIPIIPEGLSGLLRYGFPILITLVGVFMAYWFTIRRHFASPLYFMLLFGLVDGVLTMAVYGFYFYNLL